jgi:4-aminobutyrate aminotransferase-like enzyme/Ser/Thr protein kinase RdoA (MazF antagonist)
MTHLMHTPCFTPADAVSLAEGCYGVAATATPLPSERDQNFLLVTAEGERLVLKLANAQEDPALLEAQNAAMEQLARRGITFCQRVIPTRGGDLAALVSSPTGASHQMRLLTYVPGIPLRRLTHSTDALLYQLGACLGQVDRELAAFDHPALHRNFHWDLAQAQAVIERHSHQIADLEMQQLVLKLLADFVQHEVPLLPGLRRSVIHNDANDYNVIVGGGSTLYDRNQQVKGLIDFGDMVHSYTVGELAIACAYVALGKPDPLAAMLPVISGYHEHNPLCEDELSVLYGLIRMRLCASVCMAAVQQAQRPDDAYLSISQGPIRQTLPQLASIDRRLAGAAFRHACGLAPIAATPRIVRWLSQRTGSFAPLVDADLQDESLLVLDLSVGSPLLMGDARRNGEPALTRRIEDLCRETGATVAIGRYDEARLIYTAPIFKAGEGPLAEGRTIHIGQDLFLPAGTAVYAPLPGTVHAFANNAARQDFGPVLILRHQTEEGDVFYTLYGHLSEESLAGLAVGQAVGQGEKIGEIGSAAVNGGWTAHLHFQIIVDLLGLDTQFPGVCRASQRAIWRSLSPDPNLITGIPADRFPPASRPKGETLEARRRLLGRNLSIGYREPVKVERGWMQYLFDESGRRYLDAYNNVPHVGHCHPAVVGAAEQQMRVLNTNTRYLHDFLNRYAERLAGTLPDPLRVCFFLNSASEANELALRLVRAYSGRKDMIVLEGAYHGNTTGLIDISPYKHDGPGGQGAPDWVHTAPVADVYRGRYKADDPLAGPNYARHVAELIEDLHARGRGVGGYIAESCPSVGGQIFFPAGYLAAVYDHVRRAGGLCIADEVQTGYGRTGTHFYAFEAQGVVPDMVVLGKPIGNGHPIAALVTTPEIADAFNNGMEFFSTFGGNTVSCAVGLAVLETVQNEGLQAHALRVGERMLAGMRPFVDRFPLVGDVRGSGLFLGVELVRDRQTLEPAGEEASYVANRMRDHGILLGTDGPFHNVVKIRPPMPFDEANADLLVATLGSVLEELTDREG